MAPRAWQFWIDRGGTFTDCIAVSPDGTFHTAKVLSSDSAPVEAIATVLAQAGDATALADLECRVKLGTTIATNALLERRGVPTALLTHEGLAGVFDIGTQERPDLFALEIRKPPRLQRWRLEIPGRRDAVGAEVEAFDLEAARAILDEARSAGARSVAIVCMHAHAHPEDELRLAEVARDSGFSHVVTSHEMAREIGFLSRGETAIADAYLTPLLRGHADDLRRALPRAELRFMQSSGGLTESHRFRGPTALLSGPAGGVVAAHRVAREAGRPHAIGFDMGGTSTDVSLISSAGFDRAFESEVGGVRVKAPMLRIHTVAAGGGSLCRFDGIRLTVGPESAGSDPGPLCYGRCDERGHPTARELTVTDVNLALGRVMPDRFPFALDPRPVERGLDECVASLARAGFERSCDDVAAGFFEIANASMAQAIIDVSVARGVDPRDHVLIGFGGAGGQHVCALAERLGIREILLHPFAGLLSAYGIGIARASWDGERDGLGRRLSANGGLPDSIEPEWRALEREALEALAGEGVSADEVHFEPSLDLGYLGTDTALSVTRAEGAGESVPDDWRAAYEDVHRERFGYVRSERVVEIKAVRLRAIAADDPMSAIFGARPTAPSPMQPPTTLSREEPGATNEPVPLRVDRAWFPGTGRVEAPVFARESLHPGQRLQGPALILEATGTVVLDPGFELEVEEDAVFRIHARDRVVASGPVDLSEADPVRLEVLGNRFMSIAEQMGAVLRNTSVSTNIKERLDYSCAVFDRDGGLVANAPHIPVHLGAMADTIAALRERFEPFDVGDVLVTNDPFAGGSHLPDVTVVTPVFLPETTVPSFFVASRGHHADIGGRTPGSMPANSTTLEEEGVLIEGFQLVRAGHFDEERIRSLLASGRYPARRPDDNVADLEAMVAANRAGGRLLAALVDEVGEDVVHVTMGQLQRAAATKVAHELAKLEPGEHRFADALDDGTPICVRLLVEHTPERGDGAMPAAPRLPARMTIDFEGSGPASRGNLNAPKAVVRAAVIYTLRSLVSERIPLNGGCLDPIELRIPTGSILDPPRGSAVVGGNVETSQRVVDVLLGALGRAAASQGTMNNVTFGDEHFGYYETIGGGAGATPFAAGASAVHTHMTNTRITDPEILESRFPVRLLEFAVRRGSGGAGRWRGGDGIVRRYRFLRPVSVSLLTERRALAPFGLAGGEPAAPGRNRVRRHGRMQVEELAGRVEVDLGAGDELWIETPGGGGWGRTE
jgi:5-oxoprolinase (ATP-hydrolysing)